MSDSTLGDAERRLREIRSLFGESQPEASLSVGLALLDPGESLEPLIDRADSALLEPRGSLSR